MRAEPKSRAPLTLPQSGRWLAQQRLHQLFIISVIFKGLHALVELAGGIVLYLFSTDVIAAWLWEAGKSNDWIERFARQLLPPRAPFLRLLPRQPRHRERRDRRRADAEKLWAYHATFVVLTLFVAYQLYRYSYTHDIGLIAITVIDLVVMALAWNEFRLFKRHLRRTRPAPQCSG